MNLSAITCRLKLHDHWFCRAAFAALLLLGAAAHAKADPRIDRGTAMAAAPQAAAKATAASTTVVAGGTVEQHGIASWYGAHWRGRLTASGTRFNEQLLTAAHLWLPFATRAHVTNLQNGRSVDVVVTDRGPYYGGRVIDLSARAAEAIGMSQTGVAQVAITAQLTPTHTALVR